jgi:tetratricopeptide (TPR) repeat protein
MGDLWVQMLTRTEQDLQILKRALNVKHTAEEVVGYESMIRAEPSSVPLRNDVAVLYSEMGLPDKAVPHLEMVARLQPDSPAAHYNLGTALSSVSRVPEAVEQYQQALRLQPAYALAHNNLGHALLALGNPDEARGHFLEAVRLDPKLADAHYNVAMIARARGDLPGSIERLREAVRLEPDWVQAVNQLAWMLATSASATVRDAGQAIRLAEHAAMLTGRANAGVLDVLAAAQAAAGQFDSAVASCNEALARRPDQPLADAVRQRCALYAQHRAYVAR